MHHVVDRAAVVSVRFADRVLRRRQQFVGLAVGEHLDHFRFAAAQRNVVAHDAILDRVLERCIENHFDPLAADESHLHDAAAEPSVPQYFENRGRLSGLQFGQTHSLGFVWLAKGSLFGAKPQTPQIGILSIAIRNNEAPDRHPARNPFCRAFDRFFRSGRANPAPARHRAAEIAFKKCYFFSPQC